MSPTPPKGAANPWRWSWIITLSTGVMIAFGSMFYAMSVLLTDDAAGGRFSTSALSLGYGGSILIGGGLAYWIGQDADRRGVRNLIIAGFGFGAAGLLAYGRATEPWQVVAASWFLLGPAAGMTFYEPAFIAVDQWFGTGHRARALAALTVIGGLAGPIFLPTTEALIGWLGWRETTLVLAGLMAATGALASLLLPHHRPAPSAAPLADGGPRRLRTDRRFVLFTLAMVLSFGAFQSVFFHRIAAFEEAGFAVATVTLWAAVSGLLSFPGRGAGPYVAERLGGAGLYAVASLVAAAAVGFMLGAGSWRMPAHFGIFGLTFGAMLPIRAVIMSQWYSGPGYGKVLGAQWSLTAIGGAVLPALVGVVHDAAGDYELALWMVIGVFIASALAAAAAGRSPNGG